MIERYDKLRVYWDGSRLHHYPAPPPPPTPTDLEELEKILDAAGPGLPARKYYAGIDWADETPEVIACEWLESGTLLMVDQPLQGVALEFLPLIEMPPARVETTSLEFRQFGFGITYTEPVRPWRRASKSGWKSPTGDLMCRRKMARRRRKEKRRKRLLRPRPRIINSLGF